MIVFHTFPQLVINSELWKSFFNVEICGLVNKILLNKAIDKKNIHNRSGYFYIH